jgi:hypothetical protein
VMRAWAAVVLVACSTAKPIISSDISSRDTRLLPTIAANESGAFLEANLEGPSGPMTLVDGDRLVARLPNEVPLVALGPGTYGLDLGPVTGNIDVVLLRTHDANVDVGIFLPAAFTLHAPTTASRSAELTLTWDASSGPYSVTLSINGTCVASVSRTLSFDSGSYTFNPSELATTVASTCTATVVMVRANPANRQSSSVTQTRTVTFESTP